MVLNPPIQPSLDCVILCFLFKWKKIHLSVGPYSSNLCCAKINCNKIWRSCILLLFYFVLLWSLMVISVSTLCRFQLGYFSFSWKDSDPFILGCLSYLAIALWTWIVTYFCQCNSVFASLDVKIYEDRGSAFLLIKCQCTSWLLSKYLLIKSWKL